MAPPSPKTTLCFISLVLLIGVAVSDIDQDRAECEDQLIGLATCLPYVGGDAKAPTLECCSGLKQVLDKSTKCLCILIKDRDDPKLGLNINVTRALGLPNSCHAPTNLTRCVDLLHLAKNSTAAKVFEDFEHSGNSNTTAPPPNEKGNSSSSSSSSSSSAKSGDSKSDGGERRRWLGWVAVVLMIGVSTLLSEQHLFEG